MIETITGETIPNAAASTPIHPGDVLMHFIVAILAPMFLSASGGDIELARNAAIQTVEAYRARDNADLIAVAQIIACGLTALGSLSLSLGDNLSLSMTLRLRGNAVALNRVAEQNRRAMRHTRSDTGASRIPPDKPAFPSGPDQAQYEAKVLANVAAAQKTVAQAQTRLRPSEPAVSASIPTAIQTPASVASPAPVAAPAPNVPTDQQWQAMWAAAMADVAGEFTADLQNLPPDQRWAASRRAEALSHCANKLISGDVPPPPRPGDRTGLMPPNIG